MTMMTTMMANNADDKVPKVHHPETTIMTTMTTMMMAMTTAMTKGNRPDLEMTKEGP